MTASHPEFCDTSVIVHAYTSSAPAKHEKARRLLERLWQSGNGVLSVQVLQELFVTLTRKGAPPLPPADARAIVSDLATWRVIEPTPQDVLGAIDGTMRWRLSFWDAMLLTTAQKAGAPVLWSEDLDDGQDYGGTVVHNPFRKEAGAE